MNAIATGWLRPEAAVRTLRLLSTTSGVCAWALPASANETQTAIPNANRVPRVI